MKAQHQRKRRRPSNRTRIRPIDSSPKSPPLTLFASSTDESVPVTPTAINPDIGQSCNQFNIFMTEPTTKEESTLEEPVSSGILSPILPGIEQASYISMYEEKVEKKTKEMFRRCKNLTEDDERFIRTIHVKHILRGEPLPDKAIRAMDTTNLLQKLPTKTKEEAEYIKYLIKALSPAVKACQYRLMKLAEAAKSTPSSTYIPLQPSDEDNNTHETPIPSLFTNFDVHMKRLPLDVFTYSLNNTGFTAWVPIKRT